VYRRLLLPQLNSIDPESGNQRVCRRLHLVQGSLNRLTGQHLNHSPVDFYFERFGFCPRQIQTAPSAQLGMVIVIPCYDESGLIDSLEALWRCQRSGCAIEVIIVINSGQNAPESTLQRNRETHQEANAWITGHREEQLQFHCLNLTGLPKKKAGVGLARKIGMDEALHRFDDVNRLDGVIVCFDADCTCDPNYLGEIERFFAEHPEAPGCSIYFEHPLDGPEEMGIYKAITLYELHLRYYVEALRYAGFPHAFHTIGSSMAVRARHYCAQGGMNKRQAGEDFYFLHKIIPLGAFGEVNSTRVLASPRPSHRVPFGTGRAVREYLDFGKFESYPLQAFQDLRFLFADLPELYKSNGPISGYPAVLQQFLQEQEASSHLEQIREHTASQSAFQKRFFRWFDGFTAMKYIHFARDHAYGNADVLEVACEIYQKRARVLFAPADARDLLFAYRKLQRSYGFGATAALLK
jgi:hypothetical protein